MNRPQLTVQFEPRDLWVGVYWDWSPRHDPADIYDYAEFRLKICLVPMLPIQLKLTWDGVVYGGGN